MAFYLVSVFFCCLERESKQRTFMQERQKNMFLLKGHVNSAFCHSVIGRNFEHLDISQCIPCYLLCWWYHIIWVGTWEMGSILDSLARPMGVMAWEINTVT
jgi:hypothetical protein